MITIVRHEQKNVQTPCVLCDQNISSASRSWTIKSPTLPLFNDISAWVSQLADSDTIQSSLKSKEVYLDLCDHHDNAFKESLMIHGHHVRKDMKSMLDGFRNLHEHRN